MGQGPTAVRLQLGRELRRLREAADINRHDAALRIGRQYTWINRVELGKLTPTRAEVELLLNLYGLVNGSKQSDRVLDMVTQARKRTKERVPEWARVYVGLEAEASEIRHFAIDPIPGLLQTEPYARALFHAIEPAHEPAEIERLVSARLGRQGRLTSDQPLRLRVVLDEAAVRRVVGGPDVMREQLQHLLDLGRLGTISIQVLPFEIGAHAATGTSFILLHREDPRESVVYLEDLWSADYYDREPQVTKYVQAWDRLADVALSQSSTAKLIQRVAGEL